MPKPKVFVARLIPAKGLDLILEFCDADVWSEELPPSRPVLLERVQGVQGILSLLTDRIDGEVMDTAGKGLKVISNHAVGVDNVDIGAATERGIPVGNTPGILTDATADFTFTLLLAAARRLVESERYVRLGKWKTWGPSLFLGRDIAGATLGIIGFGRIGKAMAKRAAGFDMRVIYYDPYPTGSDATLLAEAVDLDTLLCQADFISLHTPLTDQTYHLIDASALARMKSTAILVNTARGSIVDPSALYAALKSNSIFAAALDVTEPEPIPMDSPLLELDNLIIAPHIASASQTTRDQMAWIAAQNLIAGLKGEKLLHCVNEEVYRA